MAGCFCIKFNGELTTLLASTFLSGGGSDDQYNVKHITIDADGYIYVAGFTAGSGFPTTQGAYDVSYNGGGDVVVLKLDSNLSDSRPTVVTDAATNVTSNSATLNGTVNANGLTTNARFEYGQTSGSYTNSTANQSVKWNRYDVNKRYH